MLLSLHKSVITACIGMEYNVRRRFLWEDFKAAKMSDIGALSNLKLVFVWEPSIDDGGPKRELFCGKGLFGNFLAAFYSLQD